MFPWAFGPCLTCAPRPFQPTPLPHKPAPSTAFPDRRLLSQDTVGEEVWAEADAELLQGARTDHTGASPASDPLSLVEEQCNCPTEDELLTALNNGDGCEDAGEFQAMSTSQVGHASPCTPTDTCTVGHASPCTPTATCTRYMYPEAYLYPYRTCSAQLLRIEFCRLTTHSLMEHTVAVLWAGPGRMSQHAPVRRMAPPVWRPARPALPGGTP